MEKTIDTSDTTSCGAKGNTKPSRIRNRKWCMTINNYSENDDTKIIELCKKMKWGYVIGKEKGEKGTPHLQIYIECKSAISFNTMKKYFPKAHIEIAKGSRNNNIDYCSKEGNFKSNIERKLTKSEKHNKILEKYNGVVWKEWQKKVIDICESKADDRKVNWFWESKGNVGKSFLAKYLVLKYNAIIADGKKDNVFNQINMAIEKGVDIKVVLLDVPRYNMEYINYGMLEQIKNGMIYSGKYEGGVCIFDNPHLIVFANEPPDQSKMSADRWVIENIDNAIKKMVDKL